VQHWRHGSWACRTAVEKRIALRTCCGIMFVSSKVWGTDALACLQIWLGLDGVDSAALWLLYISFGACVLHTHYASWERCAAQHTRRSGVSCEPHLQSQLARGGSFDGIESPPSQASAPLLSAADRSSRSGAVQQLPAGHTTLQVTVFSPELQAGVAAVEDEDALLLWQPLTLEAQRQWSWHDWGRYLICR
jgi:hypothetical protein